MAASITIPFECFETKLTADDDRGFWRTALTVVADEFVNRFDEESTKGAWAIVIGACSHWAMPHKGRWTASGGFAYPGGYGRWFPKCDWSAILIYRQGKLLSVAKLPGKRVNLFQVAVPSRTLRHEQAVVHTRWSTGSKSVMFGFRILNEEWKCVAVSDEKARGPVVVSIPTSPRS
jgi:hypothetical protein